jgi:hypothetical protein
MQKPFSFQTTACGWQGGSLQRPEPRLAQDLPNFLGQTVALKRGRLDRFLGWARTVPQMAIYRPSTPALTAIAQHYGIPTSLPRSYDRSRDRVCFREANRNRDDWDFSLDDLRTVRVRLATSGARTVDNRQIADILLQHLMAVMLGDGTVSKRLGRDYLSLIPSAIFSNVSGL